MICPDATMPESVAISFCTLEEEMNFSFQPVTLTAALPVLISSINSSELLDVLPAITSVIFKALLLVASERAILKIKSNTNNNKQRPIRLFIK